MEPPGAAPDAELARVVEDGGVLQAKDVPLAPGVTLVFVDGVRRMEAHLTLERGGSVTRAVAGAHGVGAVLCLAGQTPRWSACGVTRYVVWEGGDG